MEEEEFELEDIFKNKNKKIKSGSKGKRVEREVCKILNERFKSILSSHRDWGQFSRTVGSGNRWGQNVYLSTSAQENYSGDILCPSKFKFVLESKGGYNDIDMCSFFERKNSEIDTFLKQVTEDSKRTQRMPLLLWKKDRKPRLAFLRKENINKKLYENFDCYMHYDAWLVLAFKDLLSLKDNFFFKL